MKEKSEKSTISWIMEFASTHKNKYVLSILTATWSVVDERSYTVFYY
ncbi:MAG: hypothetical protein IJA10_02225 [Lachnospiraceae bacterium]|nr:hypothetical protein [Lachnospiraceae bacterium]